MKHLLALKDLTSNEILFLIDKAIEIKKNPEKYSTAMKDKTLLMIFEKPSLRTRLSFETGMTQMGGHAIFYSIKDSPLGKKESIHDTAKTASRYVDIIMARLNKFTDLKELADNSSVPVIDALSDMNHPCQIICDLQTIKEKKGKLKGLTLTYMGDSENNVTYSLMHGCALVGMNIKIGCPNDKRFMPKESVIQEAEEIAKKTGSTVKIIHDPIEAVKNADIVYTDSWMSYHIPESEQEERIKVLKPFQVNSELMKHAKKDALFMNCLPAMRGFEQTADVIDGPQSIVFDQAENRLHAQKAIILWLLGKI
ncbi:ornithine carbamoyltransferase [Candidatus Woesearchaeota archaeon]|nr:MAG: ornithine carbamoyltransferase [Candidatus Woesearchaeota archaeon]